MHRRTEPEPAVSANPLGIIAGGGELAPAIAASVRDGGREVFVVGVEGMADETELAGFPHAFASLGELGKALKLLKEARCSEVTFAGRVGRPEFGKLKVDARGALALPRVIAAARKGDDALLRAILSFFEKEGFRVVGSADVARDLLAAPGPVGKHQATDEDRQDIALGVRAVRALGALDIGQAAVVCKGVVLAVEAAEGTDAMLERVASLPAALRGTAKARCGVLVKAPKPEQERRVDLPVVGVRTVNLASAAGLSGIAVQAGAALVLNRHAVADAADKAGIFVLGFAAEDDPE